MRGKNIKIIFEWQRETWKVFQTGSGQNKTENLLLKTNTIHKHTHTHRYKRIDTLTSDCWNWSWRGENDSAASNNNVPHSISTRNAVQPTNALCERKGEGEKERKRGKEWELANELKMRRSDAHEHSNLYFMHACIHACVRCLSRATDDTYGRLCVCALTVLIFSSVQISSIRLYSVVLLCCQLCVRFYAIWMEMVARSFDTKHKLMYSMRCIHPYEACFENYCCYYHRFHCTLVASEIWLADWLAVCFIGRMRGEENLTAGVLVETMYKC